MNQLWPEIKQQNERLTLSVEICALLESLYLSSAEPGDEQTRGFSFFSLLLNLFLSLMADSNHEKE